ncbi:unnamed protein product [Vicia faba]|uniref:Uncharacterized protein n=1 Tax=Vicia faba TaxID=3906 RepID=A0AAV0ZW78_VICFA|nr:unnamed protein product [Vicia faba]
MGANTRNKCTLDPLVQLVSKRSPLDAASDWFTVSCVKRLEDDRLTIFWHAVWVGSTPLRTLRVWEMEILESLISILDGLVRFNRVDVWGWTPDPVYDFSMKAAYDFLASRVILPNSRFEELWKSGSCSFLAKMISVMMKSDASSRFVHTSHNFQIFSLKNISVLTFRSSERRVHYKFNGVHICYGGVAFMLCCGENPDWQG